MENTYSIRQGHKSRKLFSLEDLNAAQRELVAEFVEKVISCYEPEDVKSFLECRRDPQIESIIDLAVDLDSEGREQLLFAAEALYDEPR